MKDHDLDHCSAISFATIGARRMSVTGKSQKLDVVFGQLSRGGRYAPRGAI